MVAFVAVANHLSIVGLAAAPAVGMGAAGGAPAAVACSHLGGEGNCTAQGADTLQVSLPSGAEACPDSGEGAACGNSAAARADDGVASTPAGGSPCSAASVAACGDALLPPPAPTSPKAGGVAAPIARPSVPNPTLSETTVHDLRLTADRTSAASGQAVTLNATADAPVANNGAVIEIFDTTTGQLVGQCASGSQCTVAYTAHSGVHTFAAFVTGPSTTVATSSAVVASNRLDVSWIGLTLSAANSIAGPGQPITLTVTSTIAIDKTGWLLQIYDAESHSRLTYCAIRNTCSTTLIQPVGGTRSFVAALAAPSGSQPAPGHAVAQTEVVKTTWLAASINAVANRRSRGGVVHVVATANADLTKTPWSIGIFNEHGQLVAPVCKNGDSCSADVTITDTLPSLEARIGAVPRPNGGTLSQLLQRVGGLSTLIDIQAESALVQPSVHGAQTLWGVDSCRSFTEGGLYSRISAVLGAPDFWGRYLTDAVCPPLSPSEVQVAHAAGMGILPIYNERDCGNLSGYDTGLQYAAEAVAAAKSIGVPEGRGIAIDIEPAGPACPGAENLDTGLIHGWFDGITRAGYAPIYYGDTTSGTEFATQWCYTTESLPYIGETSYLWSFQPSLLGAYVRANAPGYAPNLTGCLGYVRGWQYQIGSSSWAAPDVDQDQFTSEMPVWYP